MSLVSCKPVAFVGTPDHRRAKDWYRDVLGLTLVSVDDFAAVFDLAGTMMRLSTIPDWRAHPHTVLGWTVGDIRAEMALLRAKGVKFEIYPGLGMDADGVWSAPGGGPKIAWFLDPDGNNLSLTEFPRP
jgi:catechol 2,3-dioxygenase-like lactoylglutathione lyase family enzyme